MTMYYCETRNEFYDLRIGLKEKGFKWNSGVDALLVDPYQANGVMYYEPILIFAHDDYVITYSFDFDRYDIGECVSYKKGMRKIEVSERFLDEYNDLKGVADSLFDAIDCIMTESEYYTMYAQLEGKNGSIDKQNDFVDVWNGKVEYVTKKDPLYYVKLIDSEDGYLNYNKTTEKYWLGSKKQGGTYQTKFTESELKNLDLRYWTFAVPVESEVK